MVWSHSNERNEPHGTARSLSKISNVCLWKGSGFHVIATTHFYSCPKSGNTGMIGSFFRRWIRQNGFWCNVDSQHWDTHDCSLEPTVTTVTLSDSECTRPLLPVVILGNILPCRSIIFSVWFSYLILIRTFCCGSRPELHHHQPTR